MLQLIPSFHKKLIIKQSLFSADMYKNILSKEYCVANHDAKMCFLPTCRYQSFLLGNVEELLQKLDPLCFTYQHVDCLYTLFKYRFNGNIVVKSGQVSDIVRRAIYFNQRNGSGDNAQHRKKETLEEKIQKTLIELLPKDKINANPWIWPQKEVKNIKRQVMN